MEWRRRDLRLGCAAIAFGLAGCAAAPAPPEPCTPFVDAHVHLNNAAMQLDLMRRHCATQAVIFWGHAADNAEMLAAAEAHPTLFIPFASISPERRAYRRAWQTNDLKLLDTLDALLATGRFKGIGEISPVHAATQGFPAADFDPSGTMMKGILGLARKYRLPVLLHVEVTRVTELSRLLEAFPDVIVIWAHGGYTPIEEARRMLDNHPNLRYELSARTWPVHPRSAEFTILMSDSTVAPEWLQLITTYPDRFIVGTDASHRSAESEEMKFASVQNLLRQLPPAVRDKVARENLLRLLPLPSK